MDLLEVQKNFWGRIVLQPNWVGTNDAAVAFIVHVFIWEGWHELCV
tara:strand:+ start:285 stop:422 length:138 start_codon:yes stop_codon:yes gene_type:complete